MSDREKALLSEGEARREFLKTAGKAVATAPVTALLLSVATKPAYASDRYDGQYDEGWLRPWPD